MSNTLILSDEAEKLIKFLILMITESCHFMSGAVDNIIIIINNIIII